MRNHRGERRNTHSLIWGVFLIGLGALFLLDRTGYLAGHFLRRWWPAWPAVFGIARLVGARRASHVGNAVMLIGISGYLYVSNEGLFGLDWSSSWPLAIVAAGLGQLAGAIASRFMPDDHVKGEEVRHA